MMIGDLMVVVAITAFACLTLTVTARSSLSDRVRGDFGALVLSLFSLQAVQWKLGGIPAEAHDSARNTRLGVISDLLNIAMLGGVFALACVFDEGAVVVVITVLILVDYLTTWD